MKMTLVYCKIMLLGDDVYWNIARDALKAYTTCHISKEYILLGLKTIYLFCEAAAQTSLRSKLSISAKRSTSPAKGTTQCGDCGPTAGESAMDRRSFPAWSRTQNINAAGHCSAASVSTGGGGQTCYRAEERAKAQTRAE